MTTPEDLQAAFGYLFVDEIQALRDLALSLPDDPVVINIGAGAGTSGLTFKSSRPDLTLITIDIQDESSPFGCLHAEREVLNINGHRLRDRWWQIKDDSKRVGNNWGRHFMKILETDIEPEWVKVDLVFIDGNHSYEGCKGDIEAWLPHIIPGGIIAVHDYRKSDIDWADNGEKKPHPKAWPGVDRAVGEMLIDHYEQILRVESLIAFRVP